MQARSGKAAARCWMSKIVLSMQEENRSSQIKQSAEGRGYVMRRLICTAAGVRKEGKDAAKEKKDRETKS